MTAIYANKNKGLRNGKRETYESCFFSVAVCVSPGKEDECGIVDPSSYVCIPNSHHTPVRIQWRRRGAKGANEMTLFSSFVRNVSRNPPSIYVRTSWTLSRTTDECVDGVQYEWWPYFANSIHGPYVVFHLVIHSLKVLWSRLLRLLYNIIQANEWHPSHDGTELFLARGCRNPLGKPFSYTFSPIHWWWGFCPCWTEWPSGGWLNRDGWNSSPRVGKVLFGQRIQDGQWWNPTWPSNEGINNNISSRGTGRKGKGHRINTRTATTHVT